MGQMIYIVDTNVIADILKQEATVIQQMSQHQTDILCLCQPVDYEVRRGLLHKGAKVQMSDYENRVKPLFQWVALVDTDWQEAAQLWAEARRKGRQLSDTDLLIAALSKRLDATIVSADDDFDNLSIKRENWRITP